MARVSFYLADQNPARDRTLGVSEYTLGLLAELRRAGGCEPRVLTSRSALHADPAIPHDELPWNSALLPGRLLADQFHPWWRRSWTGLWHYPKGFLPLALKPRGPVVGTVHDTILQHYADHHPNERSRAMYAYWLMTLRRSLARFDAVLTVSEHSRRAIQQFCERHRVKCPPVTVTHEGARWEELAGTTSPKQNYAAHFASTQPHKRTHMVLRAWKRLQERHADWPGLHLVGRLSSSQWRAAADIRGLRVDERLGSDAVRSLLAGARAVLLPSEIEGFGLPALEAHYLGTPVVYARGTAVEEVLGPGAPCGFDLNSEESFDDAIHEALALDSAAVTARALDLKKRFAWNLCAARTTAVYDRMA